MRRRDELQPGDEVVAETPVYEPMVATARAGSTGWENLAPLLGSLRKEGR